MEECVILFSDGLDSRVALKLMQERGFEVYVLHFVVPFGKNVLESVKEFCKKQKVKLKVFDCTRGRLLREYLGVLKNVRFGRGAGFNPCIDCKIWMFKKAREFAKGKKIKVIATGEVEGQRPMSQTGRAMKLIDKETGFTIVRSLSDFGINGRNRKKQIELAGKFKINYPTPAGGCLLCEKELKNRFDVLINKNLINEKTLRLVNIGRHFFIDNCWFVVARDESDGKIIEMFDRYFVRGVKGKPSVYFNKSAGKSREIAEKLREVYRTGGREKERRRFEGGKL